MQTKTKQEEEVLREIRDLPETVQEKIIKIIHFFRSEIINDKFTEAKDTEEFLSACGKWKDNRSVEEQIKDVYLNRKSTNRTEKIF